MNITVWGKGLGSKSIASALGVERNRRANILIRWKRMDYPAWPFEIEINKRDAVALASHKFHSLQKLKEVGLNTPPMFRSIDYVKSDLAQHPEHIWFGRDYYHSRGTDIIIIRSSDRINNISKDYYIRWLPSIAEYRYHVAFNQVILPTKKILAEGQRYDAEANLIRNHQNGKWAQVECKITPTFADAAIKAVKELGLDFGAVDFLNVNLTPYILEVNTAPGLEIENRLLAYKTIFKKVIGGIR